MPVEKDVRSLITGSLRGEALFGEPLGRHTSLKVGGPADIFAVPADLDDLRRLLGVICEAEVPHLVIGGGYNLLVRDGGFRGVVISLRNLHKLEMLPGNRLRAESGATNGALVRFAEERRLAGLEFLIGIPGTAGGALSVNAGAHGEAILDPLETLTTLRDGHIRTTARGELNYGYRCLDLAPGEIIIAGTFALRPGDPAEIETRIEGFLAHRRTAQRVNHPNAGSFFMNPAGMHAWRLIDDAGLRGYRIGGAEVSEVHANFFVNRGGATARDFLELAALVKERVKARCGVDLEEEVRIVGEEG